MEPAAPKGRGWRKLIGIATGVATICVGGGVAAGAGGGGIASPGTPTLTAVVCVEQCAGERQAAVGSRVRLEGRELASISEVKFAGEDGRIAVTPTGSPTASMVAAKVPEGAVTGTVRAGGATGEAETPRDQPLEIVPESRIPDTGDFKLTSAEAAPRKTYFDGTRKPRVNYLFQGGEPTDVRIEVIDRESKQVISSFVDEGAEPAAQNRAKWDGRTSDGTLAGNGEYRFRIGSVAGGEAETTDDSGFGFYKYRFPVAARHDYGDGFGAGRGHQGQDVFARCGSTLRAARGGRVKFNKTHASAGNYLVIDGKGTGMDFMYAHLVRRSPLEQGARVRTGQKIGQVGDSGNASGCHLHFEAWSAPGWYDGGEALGSVTKLLKTWDRWS